MRTYHDEQSGAKISKLQRLIYLNPVPSGQPICELSEREAPFSPWLRWAQALLAGSPHPLHKRRVLAGLKPFSGQNTEVYLVIRRLEGKL
jgi:hypothetical protein